MKSIRRLIGVKGYTTTERGHTWYGIGDRNTYTTQDNYNVAVKNLVHHLGNPSINTQGFMCWYVESVGGVYMKRYFTPQTHHYVILDKSATQENFLN